MYTKMSERPAARHSQVLLAKMLVVPVASLWLAGVATKPAWAASPCSSEGVTLVCKRADRDLRIVHDTLSPSGRYGFAWGFSTGDWTDRTLEKDDRDGSYYARDRSGVENYLVRVSDSEILKRLAGSHFGDRFDYNRWDYRVRWSPDSAWVVEQNDTLLTNAYHIERDDRVIGPFDLKTYCKDAAFKKAVVEQLGRQGKKIDSDEEGAALLEVKAVRNDGTIDVSVRLDGEDYEAQIRLAVGQKPDTLDARLISIKQSAN
jgi:hypothetical protein